MKIFNYFKTAFQKATLIALPSLLLLTTSTAYAEETVAPASFAACTNLIFTQDGDRAHYDSGAHGIPGVGNLEGSDDVYSQGSGNYLQCFCPSNGASGIQSNWWNATSLSQSQINEFIQSGWFFELQGLDWNLDNAPYLIKNSEFSCQMPTPTPTGPSTPESRCYDLVAEPEEGTAPLTVKFTAHADDPATQGKIKEYRFDFADTTGGQPQVWHQTDSVAYHRYELSGEYNVSLRIQDNAGNWRESDDCRVKVKVNSTPSVLSATLPEELPGTGSVVALTVAGLAPLGIYLYRRFRLL